MNHDAYERTYLSFRLRGSLEAGHCTEKTILKRHLKCILVKESQGSMKMVLNRLNGIQCVQFSVLRATVAASDAF